MLKGDSCAFENKMSLVNFKHTNCRLNFESFIPCISCWSGSLFSYVLEERLRRSDKFQMD